MSVAPGGIAGRTGASSHEKSCAAGVVSVEAQPPGTGRKSPFSGATNRGSGPLDPAVRAERRHELRADQRTREGKDGEDQAGTGSNGTHEVVPRRSRRIFHPDGTGTGKPRASGPFRGQDSGRRAASCVSISRPDPIPIAGTNPDPGSWCPSLVIHPAGCGCRCPASASHGCRAVSSPRPHAPAAPAACGYPSRSPADASRSCGAAYAAWPAW